jgi:hypothetical protein
VKSLITIEIKDLLTADLSNIDVLAVYLSGNANLLSRIRESDRRSPAECLVSKKALLNKVSPGRD